MNAGVQMHRIELRVLWIRSKIISNK